MLSLYEVFGNTKKGNLYIIKNNRRTYLKTYCRKLDANGIKWHFVNVFDKMYIKIGG